MAFPEGPPTAHLSRRERWGPGDALAGARSAVSQALSGRCQRVARPPWICIGGTSNALRLRALRLLRAGYYPSYGWNRSSDRRSGRRSGRARLRRRLSGRAADAAASMQRFRSYDPVSRTYIGRDRQRHPCP